MAYTTRRTVNRLATFVSCGARTIKGGINLYFGLQKHKLDQIAARNIRIFLDKRLSQGKATRKLHEGNYDIRDKKLPRTVLVNSSNYSRARRHNIECK